MGQSRSRSFQACSPRLPQIPVKIRSLTWWCFVPSPSFAILAVIVRSFRSSPQCLITVAQRWLLYKFRRLVPEIPIFKILFQPLVVALTLRLHVLHSYTHNVSCPHDCTTCFHDPSSQGIIPAPLDPETHVWSPITHA